MSTSSSKSHKSLWYTRFEATGELPKLVKFLLKTGLVRSPREATFLLLAISIFASALAFYFFTNTTRPSNNIHASVMGGVPGGAYVPGNKAY